MCHSSPTSVATDMDIDKAPGDEEATSRVGKSDQPSFVESCGLSIDRVSDIFSFSAVPQEVVVLPDDEEEVPLQERKRRSGSAGRRRLEVQIPQLMSALEAVVERSGGPVRTNVTFASPLTTDRPASSTVPTPAALVQLHASDSATAQAALQPSLFAVYQTPDDSPSEAREALRQVNLVMEQVKVVHEARQVAYNATSSLQANVQVSKTPTDFSNVVLYLVTHWGVLLLRAWEIFHVTRLELNLSRLSELMPGRPC